MRRSAHLSWTSNHQIVQRLARIARRKITLRFYLAGFFAPLIGSLGVAAIVFIAVLHQPNAEVHWVVQAYRAKLAAAQDIHGPKIAILGGSNVYFGVQAELIEQRIGIPTVNLGVHAGLPIEYQAYLAKRILKPRDLVILDFEYPIFGRFNHSSLVPIGNELYPRTVLAQTPEYLLTLSPSGSVRLLRQINLIGAAVGDLLLLKARLLRPGKLPAARRDLGRYQALGLNRWGDETIDYRERLTGILERALAEERVRGLPKVVYNSGAQYQLREFVEWCRIHSIRVLATWPNTIDAQPFQGAEFRRLQQELGGVYRQVGAILVGTPQDAVLPASLMLDTPYHPTLEGARLRSERLATALCEEIERCRPLTHTAN
jgi:hypothetical protein